ncbi:MAG: carbohydrate ABC transporter permease [Oscillospiraceae bacterium]
MNRIKTPLTESGSAKKARSAMISIARYFFLISIGYIVLFQLFYMITYSFRPSADMSDPSVVWISKGFTLQHIKDAFKSMDYMKSFFLTLSIQILSGMAEVLTCAVTAYGFARFNFFGKKIFFIMVVFTIVVPSQMVAVPMYLNYAHFDVLGILGFIGKIIGTDIRPNFLDTGLVFYLPSLFGVGLRSGLFIFIYRQFFKGLPKELEEAASIDGAGPLKTFFRVVIPSSRVAILTVAIFSIVWHWNEYYFSILYFEENYPLSIKLSMLTASLGTGVSNDRGLRMAGCLIFVLPVLILYGILQNKFIKSIDSVGIVG